jgi:hypothetical protein
VLLVRSGCVGEGEAGSSADGIGTESIGPAKELLEHLLRVHSGVDTGLREGDRGNPLKQARIEGSHVVESDV